MAADAYCMNRAHAYAWKLMHMHDRLSYFAPTSFFHRQVLLDFTEFLKEENPSLSWFNQVCLMSPQLQNCWTRVRRE